jgi:hypothetical protein
VDLFRWLAQPVAEAGVEQVMAMFHFPYQHSQIVPEPLTRSQKHSFALEIEDVCVGLGLKLSFCHIPGLHRHRCVDVERFISLHPTRDASVCEHYRRKARTTSRHCRDMIWDIGWYLPACKMGCAYCYGHVDRGQPGEFAECAVPVPDGDAAAISECTFVAGKASGGKSRL